MATAAELLARGLHHHRAGRYGEADMLYRQILTDWPDHVDAMHLMGVLMCQMGQREAAHNLIAYAISRKPNRADFHCSLGNVLYLLGRLREGGDAYKRAIILSYIKHMPFGFDEILRRADDPRVIAEATDAVPAMGLYKSQNMQDVFLDRWVFRGTERGSFIDIGAHDGITYSNTWFFEKQRRWKGVCIEPNPGVFKRLAANRGCTVLDCAMAGARGTVEFQRIAGYSEMLSGIADRYSTEHKQRIVEELQLHGGSSEIIAVKARTFGDIAEEAGLKDIAYVSIDTEGGEPEILKSIDFAKFHIHAMTVEYNTENQSEIQAIMRAQDFELIKSIGSDFMFLNRRSAYYPAYDKLRIEQP
jgi:FkbM family methyltransferase